MVSEDPEVLSLAAAETFELVFAGKTVVGTGLAVLALGIGVESHRAALGTETRKV